MHEKKHLGILLNNKINKWEFLEYIFNGINTNELAKLNRKNSVLFSDLALAKIQEEEHRYDSNLITNRKLATYSSGERKKLFLDHILTQNPDFIVLDNPLDHLDKKSREEFAEKLVAISREKTLIQLAGRTADFLPFIKNRFKLDAETFELLPISDAQEEKPSKENQLNLPKNGQNVVKNAEKLIKMDQVSVHFDGRPVLKDISWAVKKGDFWQLIGPNGSGKSTLLSIITGESTKGYGQELYLFGRKKGSGESIWEIKQQIGYFAPNMIELFRRNNTLMEMVLSGFYDSVGLYDKPSTLQQKKALQWLQLAGLQELKHSNFNALSPGQQRLGLILRAVVKNPPLLILDEPTEGLDDAGARLVVDLVNTLEQQTGMAIVFVSHRVEKGLQPKMIFELTPAAEGSTGKIRVGKHENKT